MLLPVLCLLPCLIGVSGVYVPSAQYILEVYFVVEPQVLRNYMELGYDEETAETTLRDDIKFFIYQVNKYYESMESRNLHIEVRNRMLNIMSSEMFNSSQLRQDGKSLVGAVGLRWFKDWLEERGAYEALQYDVALLWTGYDIYGTTGSKSVTGYASTRSACNSRNGAAIVEFDGTQSTAYTTAHELVHTLGSSHDSTAACPPFVGYVMTSWLRASNKYRWSFSVCSVNSIKSYIARLDRGGRNCLLTWTTPAQPFNGSSQLGRDILDVQNMCKRKKKNPDSYFCGFPSFFNGQPPQGDLVCKYLYCGIKGSRSCGSIMTTEGLVCGEGKRCERGRCLPAPSNFPAPQIQPDCLYGDVLSGKIKSFRGSCGEYLNANGLNKCYSWFIRQECCATCEERKLPLEGCEFGDEYQECAGYTPEMVCPNNMAECCFTCRNFRVKRSEMDMSKALPKLVRDQEDEDEDEDDEEAIDESIHID